jgi:tRNA(fMet)-specific endonuclease VapC
MKYLLDTCVVSDFYEGCDKTSKKIKRLTPNDIGISIITVAEVEYGIARIRGTKKAESISKFSEELFKAIKVISIDYEIAKVAGCLRSDLEKVGTPIGAYDLLIAATAKYYDLTVVTSNIREFERVEDLKIENFRK